MIIKKSLQVFGDDLEVVVNIPLENQGKSPISVYITPGLDNAGCYVYSIEDRRRREIYTSILLDHANNDLVEQTKNMSNLVTKKFHRPSYVNLARPINNYSMLLSNVFDILNNITAKPS